MHLRLPRVPSRWLTRVMLSRRIPRKSAGCLDLAAKPARRDIETIRPGRRALFEEHAREVSGIAQRLDHRSALGDDGGKIVLARHPVAECRAQAMSAEAFDFCNFNHRRGLRF